jgi:hypothetical protein
MVKSATSEDRTLKRVESDWRKWLADPRRDSRERNVDAIQKALRSGKPWRGGVSVRLLDIAQRHAIHGAVAVLDGDTENGWRELDLSFLYEVTAARIPFGSFLPDRFGMTLATALAREDDASAERVAACLSHVAREFEVFKIFRFAVFALQLWSRVSGKTVDLHGRVVPDLGIYQSLWDAWEDDARVAELLVGACEFHVKNAYDDPNGYPEFLGAAYSLFPADILAIVTARRREGRATALPDHALMRSPLAKLPHGDGRPRAEVPEIVKSVLEKAAKEDAVKPA